jgi:hypothetical protein
MTMNRRSITIAGGVAVAAIGWYAFRPERLFVDQKVSETFPVAAVQASTGGAPKALATGRFHTVSHKSEGAATIHELPDGKRVLRLTQFKTSNGPELHVYLVAADDAKDNATVKNAGFIDVAPLKGNVGDQNYDLPADVDLGKYRAVTIWCRRFGVNFATAPLLAADSGEGTASVQSGTPSALLAGQFRSVSHKSEGTATVYQLPDGKKLLRFTGFKTSNGPEVHVYLVAAADARDNATVKSAGFIDVAPLKGNVGDQNYELPEDVDLAKYRAVTIWCRRFGVNFATAPLAPAAS